MNRATVYIDAATLTPRHHCTHPGTHPDEPGWSSWDLGLPVHRGLTVYLTGTADDLRQSAMRLLAAAERYDTETHTASPT